ncbi:unnamed protein product [Tetraodon nigroviridis]|uniref:(spotted green pufferfish) hypothetical protein n=1 Tax=Tetraodon nigroviridis TaxID=99883 RepID=Q4SSP7_TETNG|nr:unnamed protein product [Tetraodon nigroviridis]
MCRGLDSLPSSCLERAKELKALFGSLLQKTDHSLNGQAKKHEKLRWTLPLQSLPGLRVQRGEHRLLPGLRGLQGDQTLQTGGQGQQDLRRVHLRRRAARGDYETFRRTPGSTPGRWTSGGFSSPAGQPGPRHQNHHQGEPGGAHRGLLRPGSGQDLRADGERLLPPLPEVLHLPGGHQKGQIGLAGSGTLL